MHMTSYSAPFNVFDAGFGNNPLPIDIVCSFGGGLLLTFVFLLPCLRRQKKRESKGFFSKGTSVSTSISSPESSFGCSSSTAGTFCEPPFQRHQVGRTYTFAELRKATKKFSPLCKLGEGRFGVVYKGKLEDGTVVAIKRAKKKVYKGHLSTEFDQEVEMLLSINHLNLVKLIGTLDQSDERILVMEFVSNGNLREHLDAVYGTILNLSTRLEICVDVAHALTYLHMYAVKMEGLQEEEYANLDDLPPFIAPFSILMQEYLDYAEAQRILKDEGCQIYNKDMSNFGFGRPPREGLEGSPISLELYKAHVLNKIMRK